MKFIVLLISLLLQRETRKKDYQRNREWFVTLTKVFNPAGKSARVQVGVYLLSVVLPAVILSIVLLNMKGFLWGLVAVILQIALFLYVLGRDDVTTRFREYQACWRAADYQGAYHCAQRDMGIERDLHGGTDVENNADQNSENAAGSDNEANSVKNSETVQDEALLKACVEDPKTLHDKVSETVVLAWFSRFFVLVFWFVIGGVPLALAALLTYWYAQEYKFAWAQSLVGAMEWIPSRLLGLTFSLAGDFTAKFPMALKFVMDFATPAQTVVVKTARAGAPEQFDAEGANDQLEELNQMLYRSAVIWLVIIGAFTLFGSLS